MSLKPGRENDSECIYGNDRKAICGSRVMRRVMHGSFFIPFTIDIIWKTSYNGDSRLFPRVLISGSAGKDGMELYFSAILMIEYTL